MRSINHKFLEQTDSTLTQTLLFGDPTSSVETNRLILNATIQYASSTRRFEEALLSAESCESFSTIFTRYYYKCC